MFYSVFFGERVSAEFSFLMAILIAVSPKNPLFWGTVSKCEPKEKHFNETISTARKQWR